MSKLCTRKPWYYCLSIGVLMNTRGIVQLVVLNIGVQLGVLSPVIFSLFVLMATILTFLTSPVLYLLYRRNFDTQKLSAPNVAEDLQLVKAGGDINMSELNGDIPTISDGDMGTNELKRESSKLIRQSHGDIDTNELKRNSSRFFRPSASNVSVHNLFLTPEERLNYPEIDPDLGGEQPVVIGNIVDMPTCPRRHINMTRF
jgi:hypothetical protein